MLLFDILQCVSLSACCQSSVVNLDQFLSALQQTVRRQLSDTVAPPTAVKTDQPAAVCNGAGDAAAHN